MDFTVRPATQDEIPTMDRAMALAFGGDPRPEDLPHHEALLELDRTRCVFDGDKMVGTLGAYSLEFAVPGATVPAAGTSYVTVRPTHRRRGLLRSMMRAHFEDVRERGEPLAALWASESSIYSRFGYGPAADLLQIEVERAHGAFNSPPGGRGQCRLLEPDEPGKILPEIYEASWRERPGHFARSRAWWDHKRLFDPKHDREGGSAYRHVIYEEGGRPRGYLQYRIRSKWDRSGLSRSQLRVVELQGIDATARAMLWRHALDVDLNDTLIAWNQPADCELPWLLKDRRRALCSTRDALWVRLVDIPGALSHRRYAREGRVVLGVRDPALPSNSGTYRLEAGPEKATCEPTREEPEIQLEVSDLGAIYLGGQRLRALARAGRVEGSPSALELADQMFAWDPAPWCPEIF
ncbi:MAG: GNAT family N-acetyltransferase [Myxococcota bacterium]